MLSSRVILAQTHGYTEGPVCDRHGNIFFTCPASGEIMLLTTSGEITVWAQVARPNGQAILASGEHIVCDSDSSAIYRFREDGTLAQIDIKDRCADNMFTTPNDVVVDNKGGVYFSDSVRNYGAVYYYDPSGDQRMIADRLDYPNGLALSSDNSKLFIAESYTNSILVIKLASGKREVFCRLPSNDSENPEDNLPDGLKMDILGNLWVAHYGMEKVHVIDPSGTVVKSISTGFNCCSNLYLLDSCCLITGGVSEEGPGGIISISC